MNIIGTGIDIVSVIRMREKLENTPNMIEKILTPGEIAYCNSGKNSYQRIAGRFAAKEAVYKVLSSYIPGLYFKDIEIETTDAGPRITEACGVYRYMVKESVGYSLSISHDGDYAAANTVFWSK